MKAELARHLGRFEERGVARFLVDAGHRHHIAVIGLVEQESSRLAVVHGNEGLTAVERAEIEDRRAPGGRGAERQAEHEGSSPGRRRRGGEDLKEGRVAQNAASSTPGTGPIATTAIITPPNRTIVDSQGRGKAELLRVGTNGGG